MNAINFSRFLNSNLNKKKLEGLASKSIDALLIAAYKNIKKFNEFSRLCLWRANLSTKKNKNFFHFIRKCSCLKNL